MYNQPLISYLPRSISHSYKHHWMFPIKKEVFYIIFFLNLDNFSYDDLFLSDKNLLKHIKNSF